MYGIIIEGGTVPLVGELIDCTEIPNDGAVLRTEGVFDYFEGVCDDLGDRPCQNRLTYLAEACLGVLDGEQVGRVRVDYGRSPFRICYDELATGRCTELEEVAKGYSLRQASSIDGQITPSQEGTAYRVFTDSKRFRIDGENVRIRKKNGYVNSKVELPDPPAGCDAVFQQCGFSSNAMRVGASRGKD